MGAKKSTAGLQSIMKKRIQKEIKIVTEGHDLFVHLLRCTLYISHFAFFLGLIMPTTEYESLSVGCREMNCGIGLNTI